MFSRHLPALVAASLGASLVVCVLAGIGCTDAAAPRLISVAPIAAAHGAMVTITGERLCGTSGDCTAVGGEVQIGTELPAILAPVASYDDTSAVIVVPDLAPAGSTVVFVVVNDTASNAIPFEVTP